MHHTHNLAHRIAIVLAAFALGGCAGDDESPRAPVIRGKRVADGAGGTGGDGTPSATAATGGGGSGGASPVYPTVCGDDCPVALANAAPEVEVECVSGALLTGKGGKAPKPGLYFLTAARGFGPGCTEGSRRATLVFCEDKRAQLVDTDEHSEGASADVAVTSPIVKFSYFCPTEGIHTFTYDTSGDIFTVYDAPNMMVYEYTRQ